MKIEKITKSVYANLPKNLEASSSLSLEDSGEYDHLKITHQSWQNPALFNIWIEDCLIQNTRWNQSKAGGSKIKNVRFEDCDLANLSLEKSILEKVEFVRCRMTGFKCLDGTLRNVLFTKCQLNLSQFRFSAFKNVLFEECPMEESDFYSADVTGTVFTKCDLTKTEMSASKLAEVDFRSSKIVGLSTGVESLQGAIIDPSQVNDLAWLLGVKIEWKE